MLSLPILLLLFCVILTNGCRETVLAEVLSVAICDNRRIL